MKLFVFLVAMAFIPLLILLWWKSRMWIMRQRTLNQSRRVGVNLATYMEKTFGPFGSTTEEILSHVNNDHELLLALCYRIGQKAELRGEGTLSETERRLLAIESLEGQVNNGGFDQYFFNSNGNDAATALTGLKDVGATEATALLDRAMAVFPNGKPPTDRFRRQKAMDKIISQAEPIWNQCDLEFYALQEDIGGLCIAYAKRNSADIILP